MIDHPGLPDDAAAVVLQQVIVTRVMDGDEIYDHVIAMTRDGEELGLADALGMMRLAEDTLIRSRVDE